MVDRDHLLLLPLVVLPSPQQPRLGDVINLLSHSSVRLTQVSLTCHSAIFYVIIGLGYGLGYRPEIAAWAVVGLVVNLLSLYSLLRRSCSSRDANSDLMLQDSGDYQRFSEDDQSTDKYTAIVIYVIALANLILALAALVLLGLLMGGAVVQGRAVTFDINGKYVDVPVNDSDRSIRIRYLCKGTVQPNVFQNLANFSSHELIFCRSRQLDISNVHNRL